MGIYPRRRPWTEDRPVEDAVLELFSPDGVTGLRPELAALIDLRDPDIEYVADALQLLRHAGMDVDDPAIFQMAVDAGHRRALAVPDDTGLPAQRRAERERDLSRSTQRWAARRQASSVVYYMRLGTRVKIGYTTDIARRRGGIQPEELLATEPGGPKLEAERHQQFAKLRVVGEWFRYEGALADHVAELRRRTA